MSEESPQATEPSRLAKDTRQLIVFVLGAFAAVCVGAAIVLVAIGAEPAESLYTLAGSAIGGIIALTREG